MWKRELVSVWGRRPVIRLLTVDLFSPDSTPQDEEAYRRCGDVVLQRSEYPRDFLPRHAFGCRCSSSARLLASAVRRQPAVLPESGQHPDGEIPAQPPRHQQHAGGELQQQSLAEERGGRHLPRPAEDARRLPDLLRWEIPQPGDGVQPLYRQCTAFVSTTGNRKWASDDRQ